MVGAVFSDLLEGVAQFLISKRVAIGKQVAKIHEDLLRPS